MTDEADFFVGIAQQALWTTALASIPILVPVLVVGLLVGIVQAATSINEATLSFVPKLVVVAIVLALFGGAMMAVVANFAQDIFLRIGEFGR